MPLHKCQPLWLNKSSEIALNFSPSLPLPQSTAPTVSSLYPKSDRISPSSMTLEGRVCVSDHTAIVAPGLQSYPNSSLTARCRPKENVGVRLQLQSTEPIIGYHSFVQLLVMLSEFGFSALRSWDRHPTHFSANEGRCTLNLRKEIFRLC